MLSNQDEIVTIVSVLVPKQFVAVNLSSYSPDSPAVPLMTPLLNESPVGKSSV